MSSCN